MCDTINLTIAPISVKKNHPSMINYSNNDGQSSPNWKWDDGKYNKSRKGDIFMFYRKNDFVQIHRIIDILSPDKRPPEWEKNDRNVLLLSPIIKTYTWNEWIQGDGKGAPYSNDYGNILTSTWSQDELKKRFMLFNFENILSLFSINSKPIKIIPLKKKKHIHDDSVVSESVLEEYIKIENNIAENYRKLAVDKLARQLLDESIRKIEEEIEKIQSNYELLKGSIN
jgi:hypothetical protein